MVWGSAELLIHAGIHTPPSLNIHATFTDSTLTDESSSFRHPTRTLPEERFFKSSQKGIPFRVGIRDMLFNFQTPFGSGKSGDYGKMYSEGMHRSKFIGFPHLDTTLPSTTGSNTQSRDDAKLAFFFVVKNWGAIRRRLRWLRRRRPRLRRLSFPFLCAYMWRNSDLGMVQHRKGSCFDFPCFERRRIGTEKRRHWIRSHQVGGFESRLPKLPRTVWTMWAIRWGVGKGGER